MAIQHANDANFSELTAKGLTLVDFEHLGVDLVMFGPIFEAVSEKYTNIKFIKFEIDETNHEHLLNTESLYSVCFSIQRW